MEESEELRAARAVRRQVLGDGYVDAQQADSSQQEFQDYLTSMAWGVWARGGALLDVLNTSSGRSEATADKFPNHVLTGRYAPGFANSLMSKDVQLYLGGVDAGGGPAAVGRVTADIWARFAAAEPGADFTRIYPFVAGREPDSAI